MTKVFSLSMFIARARFTSIRIIPCRKHYESEIFSGQHENNMSCRAPRFWRVGGGKKPKLNTTSVPARLGKGQGAK